MEPRDVPDVTLRQLAYLVAAADAGSVAAAARALHVSPSAMSDAVTEVERLLGARLTVRRRAHGLTLTSDGTRVVERARDLLRGARELELTTRAGGEELTGPLVVACYPTLAPTVLPPLLAGFGDQHPGVRPTVVEVDHARLDGLLDSGAVDVAVVYDTLVPGAVRRAPLYRVRAHVVLPAGHPLAGRAAVDLAELAGEGLVLLDSPPSADHTLSLFAARGLTPRVLHRTGSFETVRALVARGLGYGVLVQRPAQAVSYEGLPLAVVEVDPPVPPVGVDLVWSARLEPSARTRALVRFARTLDWPGGVVGAGGALTPGAAPPPG